MLSTRRRAGPVIWLAAGATLALAASFYAGNSASAADGPKATVSCQGSSCQVALTNLPDSSLGYADLTMASGLKAKKAKGSGDSACYVQDQGKSISCSIFTIPQKFKVDIDLGSKPCEEGAAAAGVTFGQLLGIAEVETHGGNVKAKAKCPPKNCDEAKKKLKKIREAQADNRADLKETGAEASELSADLKTQKAKHDAAVKSGDQDTAAATQIKIDRINADIKANSAERSSLKKERDRLQKEENEGEDFLDEHKCKK